MFVNLKILKSNYYGVRPLLNPTTKELLTNFGKFYKGRQEDNLCKLGFVKVMNGRELNGNIGLEILKLLDI